MTFTPSVLTINDANNSSTTNLGSGIIFSPISFTSTAGYNTLILTIFVDQPCNISIVFSNDGTTALASPIYKDSAFASIQYSKEFLLLNPYYRISFQNIGSSATTTLSVISRLSTVIEPKGVSNPNYAASMANRFELDAFGKLRVAAPFTLLDIKFPSPDNNSELITFKTSGAGAISSSTSNPFNILTVTSGTDEALNQSRKYCSYQPGKSLLFLGSGIINYGSNSNNSMARIGYFDDNNGVYFEYSNGLISVNILNNGTVPANFTATQSNWNIDRMQGFGESGLNLQFNQTQLFVIDFEWLGVGRVRFGFYANGIINYCHQFQNPNASAGTYMITGSLPIRYQMKSSGGAGQLLQICSTVISEGGYNPVGRPFSKNTSLTGLTTGTEYAILALSPNVSSTNYKHQNIIPNEIQIASEGTNDLLKYSIIYFPAGATATTITGSTNPADSTYSIANFTTYQNNSAQSLTGGIYISTGFATGKGSVSLKGLSETFSLIEITSNIYNNADYLIVTVTFITGGGGSSKVYSSISWFEI